MPALGIHSNVAWAGSNERYPCKGSSDAVLVNGHNKPAAEYAVNGKDSIANGTGDDYSAVNGTADSDSIGNGNDTGSAGSNAINGNDIIMNINNNISSATIRTNGTTGSADSITKDSTAAEQDVKLLDNLNQHQAASQAPVTASPSPTAAPYASHNGVGEQRDPGAALPTPPLTTPQPQETTTHQCGSSQHSKRVVRPVATRGNKPVRLPLATPGGYATSSGSNDTTEDPPSRVGPGLASSLPPSPQPPSLMPYTPFSSFSYSGVSESAGAWGDYGHHNILHVTTRDPGQHWFTRYSCYLVHCSRLKVNFPYPAVLNKTILQDERIQTALDQVVSEAVADQQGDYRALMVRHVARAHAVLDDMKAAISTTLIRLTGYVLFKVFSRLLSTVVVHKGQLEAIQRASKRGTPLIFVPLHRSHVDYLFVTWVLFNCQIPAPIVAAGENLNMPVFGALLRGTGGFFIKRRLESSKSRKDVLYRALLQCYMSQALHAGYNLEFFIEGGRTRTGKAAMPKGGLLSVILDAYLSGLLDDALVVPIAINYDKLLDGNFIREQLGQNKVPESFWGAVRAICKVLSTNYGQSRIDFGAPFSLKEFVQRSCAPTSQLIAPLHALPPPADKGHHRSLSNPVNDSSDSGRRVLGNTDTSTEIARIHPAMSNSSLFGSELTDEFRELVKKLGKHIVFDAERCQALMSTNLLAWLSSFLHRDGATEATLAGEFRQLQDLLRERGRDVGFTGDCASAVRHAARLLGPSLIQCEERGSELLYRPVTVLPNVIELNYYANALLPVFALDAIVATSILSSVDCDLASYADCDACITLELDKVMRGSVRLCELLCHEFILAPPCERLPCKLLEVVERQVMAGLLTENKDLSRNLRRRRPHDSWLSQDEESDESAESDSYSTVYSVNPTHSNLKYITAFATMLGPILDAYCITVEGLKQVVGEQVLEKQLILNTQELVRASLASETITFGESIAADPIKNCLKMLEGEGVLEACQQDTNRLLTLTKAYNSSAALDTLLDSINALRV